MLSDLMSRCTRWNECRYASPLHTSLHTRPVTIPPSTPPCPVPCTPCPLQFPRALRTCPIYPTPFLHPPAQRKTKSNARSPKPHAGPPENSTQIPGAHRYRVCRDRTRRLVEGGLGYLGNSSAIDVSCTPSPSTRVGY
eukprot:941149-Rhodomonas_salina.1